MCSQHVSSRASMGEFTYGTLVERLQAHLDGSSSAACQPWRAWNISSGRNRLFQQETCLCVKKRPDRRTVPQSSRILLVKIYIWTVYLTGHSTDWLRSAFLNTVLLNWSRQNLMQIYGQKLLLGSFVRRFLAIMMRIYGQTGIFGSFVRKIGSEASEFLRTKGCFWPFCP